MPDRLRRSLIGVALVLAAAACRKPAETAPAPASGPGAFGLPPDSSQVLQTYDEIIKQVDSGDESFMKMSLAAAGYLSHLAPGKSIGFYQPDLSTPSFRTMVEEVTRRYAFRPVFSKDMRMTCDRRTGDCTMAMADVIVEFNTTRMSLEKGWVGGALTQVPRAASNPEKKPFCITLSRKGDEWKAVRSTWVATALRCPET